METTQSQYEFLQPAVSESDSLMVTLFFAAVIHIFLVLGISFAIPKAETAYSRIEITLSSSPSKKAPKNAKFLATVNQLGAGDELKKSTALKQKLASQGQSDNKPPRPNETQIESRPQAVEKLITQKVAEHIITTTKSTPPSKTKRRRLTEEALKRQIAQLGEQIRYSEQGAENTKIKSINSVSTRKYVAVQYMEDWKRKIERIAQLNLPPQAVSDFGPLWINVGIYPNGSIYKIWIKVSSGNKASDDAAKRIIKMAAPYAAVPKKMLNEDGIFIISRKWSLKYGEPN